MERKVFANVELQAVASDSNLQRNDTMSVHFKPCETVSCFYEYPLKILLPQSTSDGLCQWIYPIIFGGGLVEGDNVNISVKIGNACCVLMTTLSFQKVYCCENGLDSQQHVKCNICSHALLCVLPDPVVCYRNASYIQTQSYNLESNANVVSLDWYTSGRYERGELWDFSRLKSFTTFYIDGQLVFKEALNMQSNYLLSIRESMKTYNIFGTCIIFGPYLSFLSEKILSQVGKCHNYGEKYQANTLFAASPLCLNGKTRSVGCIIRFSSVSVTEAVRKVEELLEPLFDTIGGNPFRHK